jgi:LmbE family N-acetylglucosaminyl deacetylase
MNFANPSASTYAPDGSPPAEALARVTHLGIGAHQDDLEIMAVHGVLECFQKRDAWFGAVTCTDGSGSPRAGAYSGYSDQEMAALRRTEQQKAAVVGDYGFLAQLDYPSAAVKNASDPSLVEDLQRILRACHPRVVYTHNLADKHDTHVAVALAVIRAARALPAQNRPGRVLGCEVWRGLDWLSDAAKVALESTGHESLVAALVGVYDSQVAGGKRYDLATLGRRRANATYFQSHATDEADELTFAMDLTPLVARPELDIEAFVDAHLEAFRHDVIDRIRRFSPAH